MERAEAEAIYDAGREAGVEFLVELSARYERQITRLEARIERLEERLRESSSELLAPALGRPSGQAPPTRALPECPQAGRPAWLVRADPFGS